MISAWARFKMHTSILAVDQMSMQALQACIHGASNLAAFPARLFSIMQGAAKLLALQRCAGKQSPVDIAGDFWGQAGLLCC